MKEEEVKTRGLYIHERPRARWALINRSQIAKGWTQALEQGQFDNSFFSSIYEYI